MGNETAGLLLEPPTRRSAPHAGGRSGKQIKLRLIDADADD